MDVVQDADVNTKMARRHNLDFLDLDLTPLNLAYLNTVLTTRAC